MRIIKVGDSYNSTLIKHYLIDSVSDLANITGCEAGSMAYNADGSIIKMLDLNGNWVDYSISMGNHDLSLHICTSNEYDVETGIPTIENPDPNTFYLVPGGEDSTNMFDEWIYANNRWEQFGSRGAFAAVLAGLGDVNLLNPVDDQTLVFDAESGKWVNGTIEGGSTYTFAEGDVNGGFTVTSEDGTEQTVMIHGLRPMCFGEDDDEELILDGGSATDLFPDEPEPDNTEGPEGN